MIKFKDFAGRVLMTAASIVECAGDKTGPRLALVGDCSKGSVLLLGTCFQALSGHEVKDLFLSDSTPKCPNAAAYMSLFESPSLPDRLFRPDDTPVAGTAAARPGSAIGHSLSFFAQGAMPRTAGIGNHDRVRIHTVNVKVGGETGVLIRGAK
jgi:hypothetical protein